jgi:hypothetical protein
MYIFAIPKRRKREPKGPAMAHRDPPRAASNSSECQLRPPHDELERGATRHDIESGTSDSTVDRWRPTEPLASVLEIRVSPASAGKRLQHRSAQWPPTIRLTARRQTPDRRAVVTSASAKRKPVSPSVRRPPTTRLTVRARPPFRPRMRHRSGCSAPAQSSSR